jgi:NAD-dependent dihydropyrimidine dehydrogenase PreA subunit
MDVLKYRFFFLLETILRFLPFPQKTGLIEIGNPNKNSPVLMTGNYHLTVLKVKRALKGQNVFLLVANSRGINLWCAAAGGHFTHHDVISALKLSNIESLVDHKEIILPQLAACGVETRAIHQRTGWQVRWGPVDIKDIHGYFAQGQKKTAYMRIVRFPLRERLEIAAAYAFWMSVVFSGTLLIINSGAVIPAVIMIWLLSFLVFSSFPSLLPILRPKGKEDLWRKRRRGRRVFLAFFIFMVLTGLGTFSLLTSHFTASFLLFWGILLLVVAFLLVGDLAGSTPFLISELREEKRFQIEVDNEKCQGDGICETVCPIDCFSVDKQRQLAIFDKPDKCVCCGACVVQCQFDALSYVDKKGQRLPPDFIRKNKVGLLGKRKSQ